MISLLLSALLIPAIYADNSSSDNSELKPVNTHQYSSAPNNTPVTKVFVFGRPLYVRQPYVLPQRELVQRDTSAVSEAVQSVVPFESNPAKRDVLREVLSQVPSSAFPNPKRKFKEAIFQTAPKQNYPLPQCYTNDSGFMCCNPRLEQIIKDTFREMQRNKKFQSCNTQSIANKLQKNCQAEFKTDFEALAGVGDFASKAHFFSDLICKVEMEGRFLLAYATPGRHPKPKKPTPSPYEPAPAPYRN